MPENAGEKPDWVPRAEDGREHAYYDDVLGLTYDEVSAERVTGWMVTGTQHQQPFGIVHGGVYASMVESLCSTGGHLWARPQDLIVAGVSNSTDFIRAHRSGRIDAVAEPIHQGGHQQLWQCVVTRASDGKLVARGQVRLHNLPKDFFED